MMNLIFLFFHCSWREVKVACQINQYNVSDLVFIFLSFGGRGRKIVESSSVIIFQVDEYELH